MDVGYVRVSKQEQNPELQGDELEAARARGRKGGRRLVMDGKKLALVSRLMKDRETPIGEVCEAVGGSRATLYRCLTLEGKLRDRNPSPILRVKRVRKAG